MTLYFCFDDKTIVRWTEKDFAERGEPVCPKCSGDMKVAPEAVVEIRPEWNSKTAVNIRVRIAGAVYAIEQYYLEDFILGQIFSGEYTELPKSKGQKITRIKFKNV